MNDERLVAGLRDSAERYGFALHPAPVPWARLRRRHRIVRARRSGMLAVTVVVVLVTVFGVGPGSLLPAGLFSGSVQAFGPLGRVAAGNRPWVEAMLERAEQEWPGRATRVPFADDVGGLRLALVETHDRQTGNPLWAWFAGPEGAVPGQMLASVTGYTELPRTTVVPPLPSDPGSALVVALGAAGGRLSVWTRNDVDRLGQAVAGVTTGTEVTPGVYVARLAVPFPQADVRLTGLGRQDWRGAGRPIDVQGLGGETRGPRLDDRTWWAAARTGARGLRTPPPGLAIESLYNALGLDGAVRGSRVLWSEDDRGIRRSVLALRAPSGGWVLAARYGGAIEAVDLRPDGPADRLSMVWPVDGGELRLLGPPGAARALVATDSTVDVPLNQGVGLVRGDPFGTVTFLAADGSVLATTVVTGSWDRNDGLFSHQL